MGLYDEAAAAWLQWQILVGVSEEEVAGITEAASSGRETYWRWMLSYWNERAKRESVPPTDFAGHHAQLGEKDQAFEWLEKAYEARSSSLINLKVKPLYDPLRDDPRFHDLLRRMNLGP